MAPLLKEPLLHFLLIGAVLFLLFDFTGRKEIEVEEIDRRIMVSPGRIEQLTRIFVKTRQRPPSEAELKALIDDFILEEAYYRQAKAQGLDQDDTLVRRRLRQKLEFLTDDVADLADPSDEDLQSYLTTHPERFRRDPRYTFRQVYINPEKHEGNPLEYAERIAAEQRAGSNHRGDSTLLPEALADQPLRVVDGTFGTGFAAKLDPLPLGQWSDPIRTGLGLHVVKVEERVPGDVPELDAVRAQVEREWSNQQRLDLRRVFNEELLKNYEIIVQWPESKE